MAYALDTNCLVRWLVRDHPEHAERIDTVLKKQRVQVADMAIAELVWVLKSYYELSEKLIAESVDKVITHESINCNRALFKKVLEDYGTSPKVSFVDLCLTHYAQLSGAHKILTFDKTLAKRFPKLVELG